MPEIKFQIESPMLSKSTKSFALLEFIFLLEMYLAIKLSESLMFFVSDTICSIDLWRDIGWKLPLQSSSLVGELGSYGNWMLMMLSLSSLGVATHCCCSPWSTWPTHSDRIGMASLFPFCGLVLPKVLDALLRHSAFSYSVS